MKRFVALIMLFAMLLSLCACGQKQDNNEASASAEPTEAAEVTAAPTGEAVTPEPTEEVTPKPTEEITPEPTATPEPTEEPTPEPTVLAFEDCAEVVARLPWGMADDEVFFEYPDESEWTLPVCFYVNDGQIYLLDRWVYPSTNSILHYDLDGWSNRIDLSKTQYTTYTEFAVNGNYIITPYMMYDYETGEQTLLQQVDLKQGSALECIRRLQMRNGKCYMYVSEPRFVGSTENEHPLVTEYELDSENLLWKPVRRLFTETYTEITLLENGAVLAWGGENSDLEYVGFDGEGRQYVFCRATYMPEGEEYPRSHCMLTRFSADGTKEAFTVIEMPDDYRYPLMGWKHSFRVDEDGTVWFMMMYEEEVVFYKITL